MVAPDADRLPAYLATREVFLQQTHAVHAMATTAEVHNAAQRLGLVTHGRAILHSNDESASLADWLIFQQRRDGQTLAQIAHRACDAQTPAPVCAMLAAMAEATLGLFRVLRTDPGVGVEVENTWNGQTRFMFEREISRQERTGQHLLLRQLAVGDVVFSGLFTMQFPEPLLAAMRAEQAAGRLDRDEEIAVPGSQQDAFLSAILSTLIQGRRPALAPERSGSIGRNDPCPCGSGQKYKRCHGRGA